MLLIETAELLVLDKPAGLSMATSSRPGRSEADVLERLLAAAALPPRELHLVHRLDVGTSGVVVLAKTKDVHAALSRAFQDRRVEKTYRALVWGHPVPAAGVWSDALARDPKDGRKMKADPAGKPARSRYRTLRRYPSLADLELSPETGRTHQIRVHAAAHGHPIAGDDFYGGATRWRGVREPVLRRALERLERPLLHAERLAIPELALDIKAPLPRDYRAILDLLMEPPRATRA